MSYITKEELEDYVGKFPENEELVQHYCDAATEAIQNYLGYDPESSKYTAERYGDDGKLFELAAFPLIELISVEVNGNAVDTGIFRVRDKNYLEYNLGEGVFYSDSVYKVTYRAGHETVPQKIKDTALRLATLMWESAGGNLAVSSTSFADNGGRTFNNFKADRFLEEISCYKLPLNGGF